MRRIFTVLTAMLTVYYLQIAVNEYGSWQATWHLTLATCFGLMTRDNWDRERR